MDPSRGDRWTDQDDLVLRAAERLRRGLHRHLLTGLLQFREDRYAEPLDTVVGELGPAGVPVSIVLADLDQLEVINDNYGHAAGDEALGSVGHALRELVRPLDMVMAGGGDAFIVILLGADLAVAEARAELARATVAQLHVARVPPGVTASFGVATHVEGESAQALFERAFQAEQRAKQLGRDRVEVAPAR